MSGFVLSEAGESRKKKSSKSRSGEKGFKWESQQTLLTYSQCDVEPQELLEFLKKVTEKWGINTYVIAQEKHQDGNKHLHVYLKTEKKPHMNSAERFFDYKGFHPKVEGCRSWKLVVKYVTKDGNYITNLSDEKIKEILLANTKVGEIYEKAYKRAREDGVEAGMKELETVKTYRDLLVHGEAIERSMKKLKGTDNNVEFNLEDFKPREWEWDQRRTLIMTGPTCTGKTSLALAFLPKALMVGDMDDLREYNSGKYHGIIFDDMSFMPDIGSGKGGVSREAQLHIFDYDHLRSIKCRYTNAKIPAKTPKIVTSNLHIDNVCLYSDPAIERRVQHVIISERVYNDLPVTTRTTTTTTTITTPPSSPSLQLVGTYPTTTTVTPPAVTTPQLEQNILSPDFRDRFLDMRVRNRVFREDDFNDIIG